MYPISHSAKRETLYPKGEMRIKKAEVEKRELHDEKAKGTPERTELLK